jgi:3-oxoacyl-[acyl-carrier protein] reductase
VAFAERVRRALVLGASSDIGVAVCQRFLDADYRVTGHFHGNPTAFASLGYASGAFESLQLDLADLDAVSAVARTPQVTEADVIVFLAALATPTTLTGFDPAALTAAVNVGALSNYVIMGAAGPGMASRGWGRIVVASSIGVKFGGGTDSFNYALANHASEFIPRTARDWAASGVLTNVVRIGVTATKAHDSFPGRDLARRAKLIPMKRAATTAEIADYLFWIGSESNTYLTGQVNAISGGE